MKKLPIYFVILLFLIVIYSSCTKTGLGGSGSFMTTPSSSPRYSTVTENPFIRTADSATSTFSIDADGASYALMRMFINQNSLPIKDAIRSEEFMNYFTYNYPDPIDNAPIAVNGEVSACPWAASHKLVRIGLKGRSMPVSDYPTANFVLLIDVSGSMQDESKLELLKEGFKAFADKMRPQDRIAIVTYAGKAGLVLAPTPGNQKQIIKSKINSLSAGGSTNGGAGINLAYEVAQRAFVAGGNNRVILGTDGDFNVGVSSESELISLIESKRDQGIFLTVLGVGSGNLNEGMMEKVANRGNGNYEYLDDVAELRKVFIDEYNKFLTVAKDVKVQVTFNPSLVEEYRLIGYENRMLNNNDFDNDRRDAGEIGAGQTITAIYEIKPVATANHLGAPTFNIDFRYKQPAETTSNMLSLDIFDQGNSFNQSSENMRFAASLVALGMYLRDSEYRGTITPDDIKTWAREAASFDPYGYRARHLLLLERIR